MTGPLIAPAGTVSANGLAIGAANTGFYLRSGVSLEIVHGGTANVGTSSSFMLINSGMKFGWSSSNVASAGADTSIGREIAGVASMSNGSTGPGKLLFARHIFANTTTSSVTERLSEIIWTNTGDADGSIINLPNDPTVGVSLEVAVTVAQTITINAQTGETIQDGASSGTSIVADAVGEYIYIVAVTGGSGAIWMVLGKAGTWTLS